MKKILAISLLVVLLLVGCGDVDEIDGEGEEAVVEEDLFDLEDLEVGDVVAGMKVELVGPFSEIQMDPPVFLEEFPFGDYNATVKFSGQTTITGRYHYDMEMMAGSVCFIPNDGHIPIKKGNNTAPFCFINTEFSQQEFSPIGSEGEAVVVIDNYVYNSYPSEVFSTAELVRVIES